MAEPLLSLRGVKTDIGRYHILHGVEFEVPEGGLTMLLGRNGAGKTTTLRTIMGMWRAAAGDALHPTPFGHTGRPHSPRRVGEANSEEYRWNMPWRVVLTNLDHIYPRGVGRGGPRGRLLGAS